MNTPRARKRPTPSGAWILLFALFCLAGCATAPETVENIPEPPDVQLNRFLDEQVQSGELTGVSVGIAVDGQVVYMASRGSANLEFDAPAKPETVYRIGSLTKQITAAAILQLVDQGKLELDAPISFYLKRYPATGKKITVRHLLQHTSGIPSYTSMGDTFLRTIKEDLSHKEVVKKFRNKPLHFSPGTGYTYNNSGYYLLGLILEVVTGQTYEEYVHQNIFRPAGMNDSSYCDPSAIVQGRAQGYRKGKEGQWLKSHYISMKQPFAAGALCSTAPDLLKWQLALQTGAIVPPPYYRNMTTPGKLKNGLALPYGFGLFPGRYYHHKSISHGGKIHGFSSFMAHYPDSGISIVALSNTGGADLFKVQAKAFELFTGFAPPPNKDNDVTLEDAHMYTGSYEFPGVGVLRVQPSGNYLSARWNGQPPTRLRSQGKGIFTLEGNPSHRLLFEQRKTRSDLVEFEQRGRVTPLQRIIESPADQVKAVALSRDRFPRYVGTYKSDLGSFEVFVSQGELRGQFEGQPFLKMIHLGKDRFTVDMMSEIRLNFSGKGSRAQKLILHQDGTDFTFTRQP